MSNPASKSDIINLRDWMKENKTDTDRKIVEISQKLTSYCDKNRQDHHDFYELERAGSREVNKIADRVTAVESNQKWFMRIAGFVWSLTIGIIIAWVKTRK